MKNIFYLILIIAALILTACSGTKKVSQDLSKETAPATTAEAKSDNSSTESVIEATKSMFQATADKDFDKLLNYMNPNIFEIVSRDMMKMALEKAMNDESMDGMSMKLLDVKEKSEPYVHEGVTYQLMSYSMKMSMDLATFEEEEEEEPADDEFNSTDFMLDIFKAQYGDDAVQFDEAKNTIHITTEKDIYATNDPAYSGWKFIEKDDSKKAFLKKIIPEPVFKKLEY